MEDLLGIECTSNPDGSITLHQSKYIDSMISRFFTADERQKFKKTSTPYTTNLAQLVIEALEGSTASEPAFPDLVKEYQRMVGSLMYGCTATRPDFSWLMRYISIAAPCLGLRRSLLLSSKLRSLIFTNILT